MVARVVAAEAWNWLRHGVPPPPYRFVHNLPNKPLTGCSICRILKTKEIVCKIFKMLELWSLWSLFMVKGDTSRWLVDSVSA
jgi:hypothetical protein